MKQFYSRTNRNLIAASIASLLVFETSTAQQVSGIITDYNTFWKSSTGSINAVKPNNSHNLLAFTYNGVQYSTGANDALLTSRGETFIPSDFFALPVEGITGTITSNTKWGWGEMKDGVHNGIGSLLRPSQSISENLTDGIKGLDLGTCVANLPAGDLTFFVNNIKPEFIGDGIPDILVTQIADPGGATDRYSFVTSSGAIVGNKKNILFSNISSVGNWTADFYQPLGLLTTLISGYTNTDRPIRLWAADLSEFGITAANYNTVHKFRVELSGTSDVAFAAYNNRSFTLSSVLPVKLADFSGHRENTSVKLKWSTASEENSDFFTIERSEDNRSFQPLAVVDAKGNSSDIAYYSFTDKQPLNGTSYYRLKMTDIDGSKTYSQVIRMQANAARNTSYLYPNPCTTSLTITHPSAATAYLTVYNASGVAVLNRSASNTMQTTLDVQRLEKGAYYAVWQNETEKVSQKFLKQ